MAEDRIHHQNISGVFAQNYSQVFAGSAQNVYFANPQSSHEPSGKAAHDCRNALFLTDPRIDRESLITAKGTRVPGTCEWIKNDATYHTWFTCDGDDNGENHNNSQLLWISGGPGKGKTMLSIFLTEELERHVAHTENSELLYFFCSAQDEKRNTAIAVLRGLLYQIIAKRPRLVRHALSYFDPPERVPQTVSSLEALWVIFSTMVSDIEFGTMFCVLDGLDECEESTRRALVSRLVGLLKGPVPSKKSLLKLAVISRDILGLQDCPRIQLDPDNDEKVVSDIEQFVSARVKELSQIKGFNGNPQKSVYVQRELLTRAEGTFLWVGFAMDELLQKRTWTEVLCSLKGLPSGLPAIYSRMLLGIPDEHRKMSRLILCWVTLAVRPLHLEELAAATNIQSSSSPRITKRQAILDAISHCGLLLQVHEDKISLIHQSAREYLLREKQDKNKILEEFRIEPKEAHLELLRTCIRCMSQSGFQHSANALDNEVSSQESPLLAYAAFHWPEHAKSCLARDVALSDTLKQFFHEKSIVRRNWWAAYHKRNWTTLLANLPLLHMQCYLGLLPLVEEVVASDKWKPQFLKHIQKTDGQGNTALHLAVKTRNRDLVRILIDNGAKVNVRTTAKQTPLHLASQQEDIEILQLLLSGKADVNAKGKSRETALQIAVSRKNETIIKLLLDAGADVNQKGRLTHTALHDAILSGDEMIIRLLLDRGADVNAKDGLGKTVLALAAFIGNETAVQLLLEKGADVNTKAMLSDTALYEALSSASEAVVWLLLEEGAHTNANNRHKKTALQIAACLENEAVVRLLLDRGADVHAKDGDGRTALHWAIRARRVEAVGLLLDRGVDINAKDRDGQTALHWAVVARRVEAVGLLLDRGVDINAKDYKGRTATQLAGKYGDMIIARLLKRKERELKGGVIDLDSS